MNRAKLIHFVDLTLLVQFALVVCSGLFIYFNHDAASPLLRLVHNTTEVLTLVLFTAHILLNWRWILFTARKFCRKRKEVKEGEVIEANYIPID
jgi:uncharacterized membrane protein YbhN (UPF0104 family)